MIKKCNKCKKIKESENEGVTITFYNDKTFFLCKNCINEKEIEKILRQKQQDDDK